MTDTTSSDGLMSVTIKRKSTKKAVFEVEKREEDGFYYITKVPKNCTEIAVGDRVLEINGTIHENFMSQTNANDLVDSIKLDVVPIDDDDEYSQGEYSEEGYEEETPTGSIAKNIPRKDRAKSSECGDNRRSKNVESQNVHIDNGRDNGEDWNDEDEMKNKKHDRTTKDFNSANDSFEIKGGKARTAANRNGINKKEGWDRPYVSQYKPRDRFMISVTNGEKKKEDNLGIELLEFENGQFYVSEVNEGPFYDTALNRGDRILSINGRKIPDDINTVEEAVDILQSKSKLTVFVLRPSKKDEGYRWVLRNT